MSEQKPKIPRVVAGLDVRALPLTPVEGFVLSRIDGSATVADIADLTIQDVEQVRSILARLERLSAIEWADSGITLPRTSFRPTTSLPRAASPESGRPEVRVPSSAPVPGSGFFPSAGGTPSQGVAPPDGRSRHSSRAPDARPSRVPPSAAPVAPSPRPSSSAPGAPRPHLASVPAPPPKTGSDPPVAADVLEMPLERRQRIDELWVALELLGHYEVLGLTRGAAKADIRKAYFENSKAFHPDTVFRKNVGSYRQKMEGIFKRLTEAYDVLGKSKARAEYDAYLDSIGETKQAEEALSGDHEIPPELLTGAPAVVAPVAPPVVASPSPAVRSDRPPEPAMPAESRPTEEGKRRARELLARKLEGATSAGVTRSSPGTTAAPPAMSVPRNKTELVRDLAGAIRASTTLTGGGDSAARHFLEGKRAMAEGDLPRAVRELRLAAQGAAGRTEYVELHDRLAKELAVSLASRYLEQAQYEERHGKWAAAALSWGKVCEGRPDDSASHVRAALALVEAKGDLHRAQSLAQRALELRGESGEVRRALGRVYVAAGLKLNARRELMVAVALDPKDTQAQSLLAQIKD